MSEQPLHVLCARRVAPMVAPAFQDGAVLLAGSKVVDVGPGRTIVAANPRAIRHDYGNAIILPGLVNAHTHLELSLLSPPANTGTFTEWLLQVMASQSASNATDDAERSGIEESLRYGVTCVGDITRAPRPARRILAASSIRAVSFGEVVGMAGRRNAVEARLASALDDSESLPTIRRGVSPHAPYSIDADGYRKCLDAARRENLPLTTHLAETAHEATFLSDHAGPFRELWDRIGGWDDSVPRFTGGPIRYAHSLGLLQYPLTLLAHVNYCDDEELSLLARGRASVAYCPRTHGYFRRPPHRWRDMLAAGINVCVGTDSRASSPDLNLVDDLRLLHRLSPEVDPRLLWEMATVRGARALGLGDTAGALALGTRADCVVFRANSDDPLREVLEGGQVPLAVWAGGRELVTTPR